MSDRRIPIELASQRKVRDRNKLYYRFNHWPVWIFAFFILPGPLTSRLFEHGFDRRILLWLGAVMLGTAIAGVYQRLPGTEARPLIVRFIEDCPNPTHRRICYSVAWSELVAFTALNIAGLLLAAITGGWYLRQIYEWAYFPIVIGVWCLGAMGWLPRAKKSTRGEGYERRYFYGTVWAVATAHPVLWLIWKVFPQTRPYDALKFAIFIGVLAAVGTLAWSVASHEPVPSWLTNSLFRLERRGSQHPMTTREGWEGWEQYAPFYDWENARTLGRRDVSFWQRVTAGVKGEVLELGCGTGRITFPLVRSGVCMTGIDRSAAMLARAARRSRHPANSSRPVGLVRGDIRDLPFRAGRFGMVLAPYGVLQSLLRERDLTATLESVARVLSRRGSFGVDLVPDVPNWSEYKRKVQMRGRTAGRAHLTLIESVRQEPRKHLTTFEQCFVRRQGRRRSEHRFNLTFRTLPLAVMVRRIEAAGFEVVGLFGDYGGGPLTRDSDVRLIMARRA